VPPPGCSCENLIGWGISGTVYRDELRNEVIKAPNDANSRRFIEVEKEIYERLGQHNGLLQYHGSELFWKDNRTAIRLEHAPNGQLYRFLQDRSNDVDRTLQMRWISQLADVLEYVHSRGVVHGDISCHNILLDEHLNAKLIDFAGSSIDGSPLLALYSVRAQPPYPSTPQKDEIFAFGSACYHILMRHVAFHELSDDDVEDRYKQGIFPELKSLGAFGVIIGGCWNGKYNHMDGVIKEMGKQGMFMKLGVLTI